jgi:hypothetical protein
MKKIFILIPLLLVSCTKEDWFKPIGSAKEEPKPVVQEVVTPPVQIAPVVIKQPEIVKFEPIGKTEAEIVAKFGTEASRIEIGEELTLMYTNASYVFQNGVVTEIKDGKSAWDNSAKISNDIIQASEQKKSMAQAEQATSDRARLASELEDLLVQHQRTQKDFQIRANTIREGYERQSKLTAQEDNRQTLKKECAAEISRLQEDMLGSENRRIEELRKKLR